MAFYRHNLLTFAQDFKKSVIIVYIYCSWRHSLSRAVPTSPAHSEPSRYLESLHLICNSRLRTEEDLHGYGRRCWTYQQVSGSWLRLLLPHQLLASQLNTPAQMVYTCPRWSHAILMRHHTWSPRKRNNDLLILLCIFPLATTMQFTAWPQHLRGHFWIKDECLIPDQGYLTYRLYDDEVPKRKVLST